jgi:hypothetical protein
MVAMAIGRDFNAATHTVVVAGLFVMSLCINFSAADSRGRAALSKNL